MKKILILLIICLSTIQLFSQKKPKLVVGIVVDQMRYDYIYDTHVPLIFWGSAITNGKTDRKVNIRDIAPTISMLLGTAYPNGCTGNPLPEITE